MNSLLEFIEKIIFPTENIRHKVPKGTRDKVCVSILVFLSPFLYTIPQWLTPIVPNVKWYQYPSISIILTLGLNILYLFHEYGFQKRVLRLRIFCLLLDPAFMIGTFSFRLIPNWQDMWYDWSIPIVLVILGFIWFFVSDWYPTAPEDLLVVIANFEPVPIDDEDAKSHGETVSADLERMIVEKRNSGVPLECPIRLKQEIKGETEKEKKKNARETGIRKGAHLVLWGNVQFTKVGEKGEFYLEPKITVAHPLGPAELEERQPGVLRLSLPHPEFFKLRIRKIEEIADIVSLIHGLALYEQQKYEDAINTFKEIKNPDAEVFFYHGNALMFLSLSKGEIEQKAIMQEAIEQFDRALEINPIFSEAYNSRGIAYYSKGEYDRAISDYNEAIRLNKMNAEAYYNRGIAYAKGKGEYDLAISDFTTTLKIKPRDAEAYNNRGAAYGNKGLFDLAINDFNQAIKINPKNAEAYNNRAVAYYYKKENDNAWEDVHKAQGLGCQVNPGFLELLRKASGRQR